MQIHQADFRTVLIRKEGLTFLLRYSLYQDGEERFPESINCREDTVVAYFLTSTIRDFLRETPWGFAVERSWSIVPEGQFALSFCVDHPGGGAGPVLLPAVAASAEPTAERVRASGWDTALPNGLYLSAGTRAVLVFSDPVGFDPPGSHPAGVPSGLGPGSVSVHRVVIDEETLARTEIRLPDPDQEPESDRRGSERAVRGRTRMLPGYLTSEGDYEQKLRLNVAAAPANLVFVRGLRAVSDRLSDRLHPPPRLDRTGCRRMAEEAIQACLDNHLLERKGVYGLRTVPGAGELSAAAGAGMACLLLDLHRDRRDSVETAARLADFALKGQHPGGLFYGTYYCRNDSWLPPGTGPDRPPQIALADTAEIACHLARFAEGMRSLGRPAERYLGAAERMAQALLASREDLTDVGTTLHPDSLLSVGAGPGGQALFELLLRLLRLSGRDAYKKALSGLFRRFYAAPPAGSPAALTQGEPDGGAGDSPLSLDQALVEARNAALLVESGYRPKGLEEYRNRLLPWICLNVRPLPRGLSMVGAVAGGLGEGRLRFRGFETALALLRLQPLVPASGQNDITGLLVSQLVGFTLQQPVGTAWLAMEEADPEPIGPVDSWLLVRELEALLRLQERFPEALNPHAGSA